jgi:hypothetical protein
VIKGCLDKGEVILSSFRVSKEYLSLLPNDIYRYEDSEDNTAHQAHCVVLTGHGIVETKEKDDDLGEMVTGLQVELYYEYLNSYSHRWGVDGFGFVFAASQPTANVQISCRVLATRSYVKTCVYLQYKKKY